VLVEPVEVEIAIDLEVEALAEAEPDRVTGPDRVTEPAGGPWWMGPVRTGVHVATIPLRFGLGALRFVRDRVAR
jgi:hypothetical protein